MKHRIVLLAVTALTGAAAFAALPAAAGAKPTQVCFETTQFLICTP